MKTISSSDLSTKAPDYMDGMSQTVALDQLRKLLSPLLIYSLATNLAMLVSPIFMMQVLDRVVPSGNTGTLLLLLGVAVLALTVNAVVEFSRDICLRRSSHWVDKVCAPVILTLPHEEQEKRTEDLVRVRSAIAGPTGLALLNLFWLPLFLIALALIHPIYIALVGVIVLATISAKTLASHLSSAALFRANQIEQVENNLRKSSRGRFDQPGNVACVKKPCDAADPEPRSPS